MATKVKAFVKGFANNIRKIISVLRNCQIFGIPRCIQPNDSNILLKHF